MTARLEWLATFELGVAEIDDDHRKMLATMQRVRDALGAGDRAACLAALDALLEVSAAHFEREEAFLTAHGYADVAKHQAYHTDLFYRAATLKAAGARVETMDQLEACCDEMMSFLIDDVVRGDAGLKSFLQAKGLTRH